MSNLVYRTLGVVFVLCFLNFMVVAVIAGGIGGDAINGPITNGHFFLESHGKLTEVSEAVYTYSLWHMRSLFITHPLGMLIVFLMVQETKRRKSLSTGDTMMPSQMP